MGGRKDVMALNRYDAREAVFQLLFETEFRADEAKEDIFEISTLQREIEPDDYVKSAYFGVCEHIEEIDALINKYAKGWKTSRISRVSRSILRLATYEMLYVEDVPAVIAINEAVELSKKYDDPKAKSFINGVLNKIKDTVEADKKDQ